MMSEALQFARLLAELGFEVWKAIERGEEDKTVGEIFAGRRKDMDKIRDLEAAARARYEGQS